MQELAEGVWQLDGFPRDGINVYLLDDVLIDSGAVFDRRRVLRQMRGRNLSAHALTHAHFDHYGASAAVCREFGVPLWCGAADAEAVAAGKMVGPGGRMLPAAPRCTVSRRLQEGDEVAGFRVLDTPGHSPGHVSFWRAADRVLVCGDVLWGRNPVLGRGGPMEPFSLASPDPAENRRSARRLAELEPALVLFGHGAPLRDTARFVSIVQGLPD
jgi:glyoxylase-like metal-dependent hydrolase (beta-lactamase superfamily II)